jgi:TCP-1/cpn60 chaperonin family
MPGSGHKVVKCTGVPNPGRTTTVLVRGSNRLVLDEAERSIHDALCVVRSLVKRRFLIAGGGAAEVYTIFMCKLLYYSVQWYTSDMCTYLSKLLHHVCKLMSCAFWGNL